MMAEQTHTVFKINFHDNSREPDPIVHFLARCSSYVCLSRRGYRRPLSQHCRARAAESKRDTLYGNYHPRCPATIRRREYAILARSDWKVRSVVLGQPSQQEVAKAAYSPQLKHGETIGEVNENLQTSAQILLDYRGKVTLIPWARRITFYCLSLGLMS